MTKLGKSTTPTKLPLKFKVLIHKHVLKCETFFLFKTKFCSCLTKFSSINTNDLLALSDRFLYAICL